jgi:repressor LexA
VSVSGRSPGFAEGVCTKNGAHQPVQSLTKKQRMVLDYVRRFLAERGHAPSYEEIACGLGLSSGSTIHAHVENLKLKGYLTKRWNSNRSIDLSAPPSIQSPTTELRLVGRIAAGAPIEAIEGGDTIDVPAHLVGRHDAYVLHVRGDSMREDHVLDGDYVIVERRETASDGEMVVALVRNSEATLKKFRRAGTRIRLEPANPAYEVMEFDESEVIIQGVVIGLLRKYDRRS